MTNISTGGNASLGQFLLEVIAIKLFGNAKAVTAILNDSDFNSDILYTNIANGLMSSLVVDTDYIFSEYIKNGKISPSETFTSPQNFDFSNSSFTFPLYLSGSIPTILGPKLQNGSSLVTVGSKINNFSYNVPILLTIDGM
jgi:hypothetical protein